MKEITAFRNYLNEGLDKKPQIEEKLRTRFDCSRQIYIIPISMVRLVALDDVDDKYHDSLELVYKKGDRIEDIDDDLDDEEGEGEGYYGRYPSGMIAPEDLYDSEKTR